MTAPGTERTLGTRYRLVELVASGGMGEVWRAEDTVLGRIVAVKILRREYADDPIFLARFRNEARHTAGLSHAGIAAVYDFGEGDGEEGGSPYLVMEHVPGEPLAALVSREGSLTPQRTLEIIGHTALGLQAAHDAGVIHRDVKPGNILVTPDGEVKVTDFGIARATNAVPLTRTGTIMGTAFYISPEQASGRPVTPASDVYSLGIVAYECLTGRRPFDGDTPVSVALAQVSEEPPALPDDLPQPVRALVMRMLAKDPADRPAAAGELAREALALAEVVASAERTQPAVAAAGAVPVVGAAYGRTEDPQPGPTAEDGTTVVTPRVGTDTDPGFRLPDGSGLPRWLPYAVGLVLAVVVLLLGVRACSTDPGSSARTTGGQPQADATPNATVDVVAADYRGRPEDAVRSDLTELGLQVRVAASVGAGDVGTVKDVTPTGRLDATSSVTIVVVEARTSAPVGHPGKPKHRRHHGHEKHGEKKGHEQW